MAITFKIIPELRLVESVVTGTLTNEDILNHDHLLKKTEAFDPAFNHLLDFTQVTDDQVTAKGLRELAENTPFDKSCRRAYITTVKEHEQRAGFLAILMNTPDEHLLVTQDRKKAFDWIMDKQTANLD